MIIDGMKMKYNKLVIDQPEKLIFGSSPYPVTTARGLEIGGGIVYPELNFTLPPISINKSNMKVITNHYREIVSDALERAVHLHSSGVILEFETLIEMTRYPEIGVELVKVMNEICEDYFQKEGLKSEIRLTPNDIRDFDNPPKMRTSIYLDSMLELFDRGSLAGSDLLSIESTGGKEYSDDSLMNCNIKQFIFSQAILGVRDMKMLWGKIVEIAEKNNKIPAGDTACGFGNTAMVLAEKKYIPKIFAAIVRIATIVRTLVAIEEGAKGPDKDCGYEGPYLKAITGRPISMEGKTSACAHFSPLGNIAAACCDLWSNESVQNIKLLAGNAPTVYMEQLEYDTRLMNQAIKEGNESILNLQRLYVNSDIYYDPQAIILDPKVVIEISKEIVRGKNYIEACVNGCIKALDIIEDSIKNGTLITDPMEEVWFDMIRNDLLTIPKEESEFVEEIMPTLDPSKVILSEYGL